MISPEAAPTDVKPGPVLVGGLRRLPQPPAPDREENPWHHPFLHGLVRDSVVEMVDAFAHDGRCARSGHARTASSLPAGCVVLWSAMACSTNQR